MANGLEPLKRQAKALASAPIVFGAILVLLVALIWGFVHWSYRGLLSGKDAQIASLERRLDDYRNSVDGASPEEARRRMESLETELSTLRIRLTQRRLTPAQRQAISDRSRRPAGTASRNITITAQEDCGDCKSFAAEIAEALAIAENWTPSRQDVTNPKERPRSGLAIRVAEPTRPPMEAVVLQQALQSAGLAFSMLASTGSSELELLVTEPTPQ
jgi:hypothetical protein